MDRGALQAIVHGVAQLETTEQLTLSLSMNITCFAWLNQEMLHVIDS